MDKTVILSDKKMEKTVTLSEKEIFEIILALDYQVDESINISKEASQFAKELELEDEKKMWLKISEDGKKVAYFRRSLVSKFKKLFL